MSAETASSTGRQAPSIRKACGWKGSISLAAHPLVGVAVIAAVRRVHGHQDPRLHHLLPERVELGQPERAGAAVAGNRRRADQHDRARARGPIRAPRWPSHDGQGDDRGGEDPVLVVELQVSWIHSLSAWTTAWVASGSSFRRSSTRLASVGNIGCGPALLVHELQPGAGLAEGRDGRIGSPKISRRSCLRVAVPEVVLLGPRPGHHLEGRVGDVLADAALHHDLGAAADLHVVDAPLVASGRNLVRASVARRGGCRRRRSERP